MFNIGEVYNRRLDLHKKYGGNIQSGIAPCANHPIIFIFTSPEGKNYGYEDRSVSETEYLYTGEGQFGDMELTRNNLAIVKHKEDGREIYLFKKIKSGFYEFIGEFEYISYKFQQGVDTEKKKRNKIVFTLRKITK